MYRRARLRTPTENAIRDLTAGALWWDYLLELLIQQKFGSSRLDSNNKIVVLQTKARSNNKVDKDPKSVRTIDLSQDPFGWDRLDKEDALESGDSDIVNLNHLDAIVRNIQGDNNDTAADVSAVMIDSLTPFWMRHGVHRTIQFLRSIQQCVSPTVMIVPVDTSVCLSKQQHRALEDLSSAVLCLRHGEAIMLRQGVRERDNVVRQSIAYEIAQKANGRSIVRIVESEESFLPKGEMEMESANVLPSSGGSTIQMTSSQLSTRKPKVKLAVNEDARATTLSSAAAAATSTVAATTTTTTSTSTGPRIFMQDDDPEFDDYDEEDPDDDLEI